MSATSQRWENKQEIFHCMSYIIPFMNEIVLFVRQTNKLQGRTKIF